MVSKGLYLCKDCHKYLHRILSEKELGRNYNTKEAIMKNVKIKKFLKYIKKQN